MTKKEREYYNDLSIKAFGVKSRWQTMLKKPRIVNKQTYYLTLDMVEKAMIEIIERIENVQKSSETRSTEATDTSTSDTSSGGNS